MQVAQEEEKVNAITTPTPFKLQLLLYTYIFSFRSNTTSIFDSRNTKKRQPVLELATNTFSVFFFID